MPKYKGAVTTEGRLLASTWDHVHIKLVGTDGTSELETISTGLSYLSNGSVLHFEVNCQKSFGKLVWIELKKTPHLLLPEKAWFPAKVKVDTPEGESYHFPIYRWITNQDDQIFMEGTALTVVLDIPEEQKKSRTNELEMRKKLYKWKVYAEGIPHCMMAKDVNSLPDEVRFSFSKDTEFKLTAIKGRLEMILKSHVYSTEKWTDFHIIGKLFHQKQTTVSEYIQQHWMEDRLFGYEFLNGVNPMVIHQCLKLPENFEVTNDMVFVKGTATLEEELKKGNIFLCDYKFLDQLPGNKINGKQQYLMAPLVLLHKTPDNKLMPIAIQLKQKSSTDNPIFLPNDSEYDWLLAKMFVRSADFNHHQLTSHLLRTHLLAEVFSVSLLRNLPMVHPLYKLLIPHTRDTLQINVLARELLISEKGIFNKFTSCGRDSDTILRRATRSLTYRSLCIRDDIEDRGLESVPGYYYRDDGFQLWDIIESFVRGVLNHYYTNDSHVKRDTELQTWVQDIFEHGFLQNPESGMPQTLSTVAELVKFVTMVIFTCSAQHAAVNSGQFDFGSWMPNSPTTLQQPPPTTKGKSDQSTMLSTLPDFNVTIEGGTVMWLLSKQSSDFVRLGDYPEEHFSEFNPCQHMVTFKRNLRQLGVNIRNRNVKLPIPYTYLDPDLIENSIAL